MRIGLIYFSPTENTAKIAAVIKIILEDLNNDVEEFNVTNYSDRSKSINLGQIEAIIFGFPNYYGRAPKLIREWLTTLEGDEKKCSVFFTYGGVHVGLAYHNIKNILSKQNLILVSAAQFVAKHTYNIAGWKLNGNRPNQEDFEIAKEYARKTYERFIGEDSGIVSFKPTKSTEAQADESENIAKSAIPLPFREEECSLCRICEELCPANAMNAEKGKPDSNACIRCLRCVVNCPEHVLKTNDMTFLLQPLMQVTKTTEEIINSRKSEFFL